MMLVYMFYLKKGCKKMQKNIEKNAKKCMTNDKIYAILIIVYCSLCKWSMGHSAERKHYGLFFVSLFNIPDPESIINICFHGENIWN